MSVIGLGLRSKLMEVSLCALFEYCLAQFVFTPAVLLTMNDNSLIFMVALCNRADHYIFILFLLSSSSFFFLA